MKFRYYLLAILSLSLMFNACNKSEDDDTPEPTNVADRGEQQIIDNDSLVGYLETHYYNSGDFVGNPNPSMHDLVITELLDGETVPVDHTLLMDAVQTRTTVFSETDYEYYVLKLNQGPGDTPNFSDTVRLNYSGNLLDESVSRVLTLNNPTPQEFVATNDTFGESGTPAQLMEKYGLNSAAIIKKAKAVIARK